MPNTKIKQESRADTFKNETTRQRWDLFHQAIAHAKQCNEIALEESQESEPEKHGAVPLQTVQR